MPWHLDVMTTKALSKTGMIANLLPVDSGRFPASAVPWGWNYGPLRDFLCKAFRGQLPNGG